MSQPALKCENNAIFKQNYTLELFIALKMAYCCCLGLRGNLDFPDFLQKKFYDINSRIKRKNLFQVFSSLLFRLLLQKGQKFSYKGRS